MRVSCLHMCCRSLGERRGEGESELSPHVLQIPGRWEVFIEQLKTGALEDCVEFYVSDVALLLDKYGNSKPLLSKTCSVLDKKCFFLVYIQNTV